ncbi:MAG: transcriptional regulator [Euryarchaeota archaeon]|nr:transcriptional regulator [Euryarchaeota archaeon]
MEDHLEGVILVETVSLRGHEEVIPDNLETRTSKMLRKGFYKPIIVDRGSMVILDGHHKWNAAKSLGLARVPVILVDYLVDEGVLVDVWPDCGRESITKTEVLEMGVSGDVFPPKTSRHTLPFKIPSISIPLSDLEN